MNAPRKLESTGLIVILFVCGVTAPSYSQCAGCGADYNRMEREKVFPAYEAGKKQGYEQGRRDGANQERLNNSINKLLDNSGQMGSSAVKGR
ncbi:MAG: hypothetical protein QOJ15_10677 [Bradyrhizobium sp.]|nr:hypothetical protein [Bradyrhizobium sp.]